jgi:hypothetical protein
VEVQARVQKALELLQMLPAGTDAALKQQIVSASLKTFGVPIEKIIEASVQEMQALDAYIGADGADVAKVLEDSRTKIEHFEREVERIKTVMTERASEHQAVTGACNDAKLAIQRVLEFFGQDTVARVVKDSPKLLDPSQGKA